MDGPFFGWEHSVSLYLSCDFWVPDPYGKMDQKVDTHEA